MKRISILTIALLALSFGSCKKAYTCECTTTDAYGANVSTREISKTSKKTAEAICGDYTDVYTPVSSGSGTGSSMTQNTNCALK